MGREGPIPAQSQGREMTGGRQLLCSWAVTEGIGWAAPSMAVPAHRGCVEMDLRRPESRGSRRHVAAPRHDTSEPEGLRDLEKTSDGSC